MNTPTFNCDLMERLQMFARPSCIGRLAANHAYSWGSLYLYDGLLIHAEVDGLEGLEACYHMLAWGQCDLSWEEGATPPASTMESTPDALLNEFLTGNGGANAKKVPTSASGSNEVLLIQILNGPRDGEAFEISQPTVMIGSDPCCEICLPDDTVSRLHCQIRQAEGHILAEDLNSTNGTWLNTRPFHSGEIQSGDTLQVGQTLIQVGVVLKRPAAASNARQTMKIGRPVTGTLPFPKPKTAPIHWENGNGSSTTAKKGPSKGLWKRLLTS